MEYFIFFGAGFCFVLGIGQLVKRWHVNNLILSALFISIGYVIFYLGMTIDDHILGYPHMLFTTLPFLYLLGPLAYFYLTIVTSFDYIWKWIQVFHFLPFLLSIFVGLHYWFKDIEEKRIILEATIHGTANDIVQPLFGPSLAIIVTYIALMIYNANPFVNYRNKVTRLVGYLLITWGISAGGGIVLIASGDMSIAPYTAVFLITSVLYIYFISHRYPDFLTVIGRELQKTKYEKSLLKTFDVKDLQDRIHYTLKVNKIYRHDDITLKTMASELKLNAHQLSQYINEHENMTFNALINKYRIEEAKEILREDLDKRVLSVAYDVGFNSISAFSAAFQKNTGLSPTDYRKIK